jgi:hypothetical protein
VEFEGPPSHLLSVPPAGPEEGEDPEATNCLEAATSSPATEQAQPELPIGFVLRPLPAGAPALPPVPGPSAPRGSAARPGQLRRGSMEHTGRSSFAEAHPAVVYEQEERRRALARADVLSHRASMAGFCMGVSLPCLLF